MEIVNLWNENTDLNIVKTWLLGTTDGQTYPIIDRWAPKFHTPGFLCLDGLAEFDDIIGYKYDWKLDDPNLDAEAERIVRELDAFIEKVNAHPELYSDNIVA